MKATKKRKRRRRKQYTCRCGSYRFPHRFGGGRCNGGWIAEETWNRNFGGGICANCNSLNKQEGGLYCEVVEGQEYVEQCPAYQEFIQYHEIRIKVI